MWAVYIQGVRHSLSRSKLRQRSSAHPGGGLKLGEEIVFQSVSFIEIIAFSNKPITIICNIVSLYNYHEVITQKGKILVITEHIRMETELGCNLLNINAMVYAIGAKNQVFFSKSKLLQPWVTLRIWLFLGVLTLSQYNTWLLQTYQNLNTLHQYSESYIGFQSNNPLIQTICLVTYKTSNSVTQIPTHIYLHIHGAI